MTVDNLSGTATAGGQPAAFTLAVANTGNGCTKVRANLTVRLSGLDPNKVRVERIVNGSAVSLPVRLVGVGVVQADDVLADASSAGPLKPVEALLPLRLCGTTSADSAYRLRFLGGASAGRATVTAQAVAVSGQLLGSDAAITAVVAPAALPPATPPTDVDSPPATEAPATKAPAAEGSAAEGPAAGEPAEDDAAAADVPQAEALPPTRSDQPATHSKLAAALIATGLGAAAAVGFALLSLSGMRVWRRRAAPVSTDTQQLGVIPVPKLPALEQRPTLPSRWPALASNLRRGK